MSEAKIEKIETIPPNLFAFPDLSTQKPRPPKADVYIHHHWSPHIAHELIETANALVLPHGKGIYATDEAPDSIQALFDGVGVNDREERIWANSSNKELRRDWRKFAYHAISNEYISGVIMYPETLIEFGLGSTLVEKGIIPGVRANGELMPIPSSNSEFYVEGLDGLLTRLQVARASGARFAKWRVQIACTSSKIGLPSTTSLEVQAETLGRFAAVSQEAGLVPIVEPDIEFNADADLERSAAVHEQAISMIYGRMKAYNVLLEGSLIKPSFPQPGLRCPDKVRYTPEGIAFATASVISRSVPVAVPGVLFLSGGMSPETATNYIRAVNDLVKKAQPPSPFCRLPVLTFSFGRAIQGEALKEWVKGNEDKAKELLLKWSKACGQAVG